MENILVIKAHEGIGNALAGIINGSVQNGHALRNSAGALPVGVIESAAVYTGYAVIGLDHLLHGQTGAAERGGGAQLNPAGVLHGHQIAHIAGTADGFQNDAVAVGIFGGKVIVGFVDLHQRGVGFLGVAVGMLAGLDDFDFLLGEVEIGQPTHGTGFPDAHHEQIPGGGAGTFADNP